MTTNETENEKTGTSWLRREITDQQQENRDKLRKAMAEAGVGGLNVPVKSATSKAAHRHVESKSAEKSQSRSSDAGQYLSL